MKQIQTIAIVGAGAMGRGIAQIAAQAGKQVLLYDLNADSVKAAFGGCTRRLEPFAGKRPHDG